jgi:lichenan operon transcriptional antiterminator
MDINERTNKELQILNNRDYTPAHVLAEQFGVSERTIRNDIATLNHSNNKNLLIRTKRKKGYYLILGKGNLSNNYITAVDSHRDIFPLDTKIQRKRYVICTLLLSDVPISFAKLAQLACIAEDTVKTYMQDIRKLLRKFGLNCFSHRSDGILIYGSEINKRNCFLLLCTDHSQSTYITSFDTVEIHMCNGINLERIRDIVSTSLAHAHITASDRNYKDLVLSIGLTAARIKSRHPIQPFKMRYDTSNAILATEDICKQIEPLIEQPVDRAEHTYIYQQILKHTNASTNKINSDILKHNIDAMLNTAFTYYNIDLRADNILKSNLFKHLSLIFSDHINDVKSANPLLETIKQGYPFPFDIALAATEQIFNKKPMVLNEGEVGYIALHIGAAIERNRDTHKKPCKIILVCSEGRSVQQIFYTKINALFNEDIHISCNITFQELLQLDIKNLIGDLIISTVPLDAKKLPMPYLLVRWSLPTSDIQAISRSVTRIKDKHANAIDSFFTKESFMYIDKEVQRDQLLKYMCDKLIADGVAQNDIFSQVNRREKIADTAITSLLAIPHPLVPCTHRTRISVAILAHPIIWSSTHNQVRLVMLLAIKPSTNNSIEEFYDLLTQIIANQTLQKRLLHITTYAEFLKIIRALYTPTWS